MNVQRYPDQIYIQAEDIFDVRGGNEIEHILGDLLREKPHMLTLDLGGVSYVSAHGLQRFFQNYVPLFRNGFTLQIINADNGLMDLLRLSGFHLISQINPPSPQPENDFPTFSFQQNM